ncbi:MAG: hypothetical protein D6712_18815, partial [Chloroflexi bacterium]
EVRSVLHGVSPLKHHPVDCVLWIQPEKVLPNSYNPNVVAPVEMKLLHHSIDTNGYTMPVVAHRDTDATYEVVDGFHRRRACLEFEDIYESTCGRLPITLIRASQGDINARVAATIVHNRARGKHVVGLMADIVADLSKRNWSDARIAKELGMEPDEVLRLKQVTGLAEIFADRDFSEAWEIEY